MVNVWLDLPDLDSYAHLVVGYVRCDLDAGPQVGVFDDLLVAAGSVARITYGVWYHYAPHRWPG